MKGGMLQHGQYVSSLIWFAFVNIFAYSAYPFTMKELSDGKHKKT
jgi:hypothetical protein